MQKKKIIIVNKNKMSKRFGGRNGGNDESEGVELLLPLLGVSLQPASTKNVAEVRVFSIVFFIFIKFSFMDLRVSPNLILHQIQLRRRSPLPAGRRNRQDLRIGLILECRSGKRPQQFRFRQSSAQYIHRKY